MARLKNRIQAGKFLQVVLIAFAVIQGISFLLSELDIFPIIKGGWFLLLMLAVIGLTTLFSLGRNITTLELKKNLLFIILVLGAIIASFIFLPDYLPQIFSASSLEIKDFLREVIGTIAKVGTGVV